MIKEKIIYISIHIIFDGVKRTGTMNQMLTSMDKLKIDHHELK
jgi:hypothetical protein